MYIWNDIDKKTISSTYSIVWKPKPQSTSIEHTEHDSFGGLFAETILRRNKSQRSTGYHFLSSKNKVDR